MNRKNGLKLQREKEEWESCLPEDRLSGLFVTAELKTGDRGREVPRDFSFLKTLDFCLKGQLTQHTKRDIFPLT